MRTTPERITKLEPNEIFVFGSNLAGRHGKGAAKDALKFGAEYGIGQGQMRQTYAIATKDHDLKTQPFFQIKARVQAFLQHAVIRPHLTFLVTPIGCGLAGYNPSEIGPMFKNSPPNVVLPACFLPYV